MTEEGEDARMRALFGAGGRPPMGDEAFVASVMGRVQEAKASDATRRNAAAIGGVAMLGALLWPYKTALATGLTLNAARYTPDLSMLSGGASALLIAAVASVAAWAYAERG